MIHESRITITRWSPRFIQYRVHTLPCLLTLYITPSLSYSTIESVPFRSSSPLFPPLPLSLYPPVNKAEAWDYLTFIRFRGESASLTSKEARVEPGSAHCGTWRWAFDPCSTFFDDIPLLFAKDVASRPPRDTRTRRVFAGYRALPSTGRDWSGEGCCRFNWRPFE